jgi:hypothetical protein
MGFEALWAAKLSNALGVPVKIAIASEAVSPAELTAGERLYLTEVASPSRERWLLGRAALKRLLSNTPDRWCSGRRFALSQSGSFAVAVDVDGVAGTGVNLELESCPRPEAARFFLSPEERAWALGLGGARTTAALKRLWTVKEALFKADPEHQTRCVVEYRLDNPSVQVGLARSHTRLFRYASFPFDGGFLSIAVAESGQGTSPKLLSDLRRPSPAKRALPAEGLLEPSSV